MLAGLAALADSADETEQAHQKFGMVRMCSLFAREKRCAAKY